MCDINVAATHILFSSRRALRANSNSPPLFPSSTSPKPPLSRSAYSARHPGRADYTSGFLHSATLHGLKPSSTYFYSCGDDALAMSSVRSFVTPPKIGPDQAITLGILGDLGQTEESA